MNKSVSKVLTKLTRLSHISTESALDRCNSVGSNVVLFGRPRVVNGGHIVIGSHCQISSDPVQTHIEANFGGSIEIGDNVVIGCGSGVASRARIRIGSGTRIGAFVLIMDSDYHVAGDSTAVPPKSPVEIANDVKIGHHVTILRGSSIGDGATVLDGSVVSGVVPDGATIGGVPGKLQRQSGVERHSSTIGTVHERLTELIVRWFQLDERPDYSTKLSQLPGYDMLGLESLFVALEGEFGVCLNDPELVEISTLRDLVGVVESSRL